MSPAEPASARTRVVVQVWWRDCLLHSGAVRPGGSFCLGEERADLAIARETLGSPHEPLVVHRDGIPFVRVPARAEGSLTLAGGHPETFGLLRREPTFRSRPTEAIEVPLPVGAELELELGALSARIWRPAPQPDPAAPPSLDVRLLASMAGSGLAVLASLGVVRHAMPPLGEDVETELADERYLSGYVVTAEPALPEEEEIRSPRRPRTEGKPGHDTTSCRCREHGAMGSRQAERSPDRYGVQGPQDNPDPHLARDRGDWSDWLCIAFAPLLDAASGDRFGPLAPWGRDDALGTDPLSARGHMWGDEIADAQGGGEMGFGDSGDRPEKVILATAIDSRSQREPPRIYHAGLRLDGPLEPLQVLPVVAARFPRFQGCYAEALAADPATEGRVEVVLEIDTNGSLAELGVGYVSVVSDMLPSCLRDAFDDLSFPRHEGGPTRVSYPLVLEPGSADDEEAAGS